MSAAAEVVYWVNACTQAEKRAQAAERRAEKAEARAEELAGRMFDLVTKCGPPMTTFTEDGRVCRVEQVRDKDGSAQQIAYRFNAYWEMGMPSDCWMDGQPAYCLVPIEDAPSEGEGA